MPVGEASYDWDLASDGIRWSGDVGDVTGIRDLERISTGTGYAEFLFPGSESSRYEAVTACGGSDAGGGVGYTVVYGLLPARRSSLPPVWVEDSGRWFADACDRPRRAHGVIRVVAAPETTGSADAEMDGHAPPGTADRARFIERVTRRLSQSGRRSPTFAILLIALDRADQAGALDETALAAIVAHLRADMRAEETLARDGGDSKVTTFAVLLDRCDADQAMAAGTRFVARAAEALPGVTAARARIGCVLAPDEGRTPEELMRRAGQALLMARQQGNPAYVRYGDELARSAATAAREAADDIVAALNDGRVTLALQPVVAAATRQVWCHEALVRVLRLDGTIMRPADVMPVAEEAGLVASLDLRILNLAFTMLSANRKLRLSVNVSGASLGDAAWLDHLRAAGRLRPDAARRLTVEIKETWAIDNVAVARSAFTTIRSFGVAVAIDGFGPSRSSFRTLRQLPIDLLKIDGPLARDLATGDTSAVRALVDLARNLLVPIVAGWVETEEAAGMLAECGIDYLQGDLFGVADIPAAGQAPVRAAG